MYALNYYRPHGNEQYYGVEKRDEHRAFLVSISIVSCRAHLGQFQREQSEQQAEHIAEVVSRVGKQSERVAAPAQTRLYKHEQEVERYGQHVHPVQGFGRLEMMVVVMVVHGVVFYLYVTVALWGVHTLL